MGGRKGLVLNGEVRGWGGEKMGGGGILGGGCVGLDR